MDVMLSVDLLKIDFFAINIGFNSYCDHYVISSSEYWIIGNIIDIILIY